MNDIPHTSLTAMFSQAAGLIKKSRSVALLVHYKPDADALGAATALSHMFAHLGKHYQIISPGGPPQKVPYDIDNFQTNTHTQTPDLIISCDTANYDRCYYPEEWHTLPLINIDHHMSNSINGTVNIVDPHSASTCELIYQLFIHMGISLPRTTATVLLYGILSDTQAFSTSNTTAKTLATSGKLIACGAPLTELSQALITHTDHRVITLWGSLLEKSSSLAKQTATGTKEIVWTTVTQKELAEKNCSLSDLDGFINYFSRITKIDITLFFYEQDATTVKVSLRSKESDVNSIAQKFQGGGHPRAAGATSSLPLMQFAAELIAQI